jgi:hypothetical protein
MEPRLDPVSVAIALMTAALGPSLAPVIGPYAVIVLAATTGAAWSLGTREPGGRWSGVWYFTKINMTAIFLTVGIATAIGKAWPDFAGLYWILAPVAMMVGGIGDRWPLVGRWILRRFARVIERRSESDRA